MFLSVIILAAGKGTRMNSSKPKVFHEIANYPLLYHVIDSIKQLKPNSFNIVVSNEIAEKTKEISKLYKDQNLKFSVQKKQLGTGHAVKCVKDLRYVNINDVTLILFADTPLIKINTLKKLVLKCKNKADLTILAMQPEDPKNYGRVVLKNGMVEKIVEFSEATPEDKKISLCNSGVMAVKTKLLLDFLTNLNSNNSKKEFFLTDLVDIFVKNKKTVVYHKCDYEETLGVNDREDLHHINNIFQKLKYQNLSKNGVSILDKNSVYFSYDTKIGKDSVIYPNVYFGKNVKINKNVKVKSFSNLEDVYIAENCEIGPFARIRSHTNIEKNTRIGNFVELKKSKISQNVKISHLSYIGDASIDLNTNIGAGTITCNYDGKNKNKTEIGENCFIGSNSSLIAPIKIKKNSIVGAGTVLKNDVSRNTTVFRKSTLVKKKNMKSK